MAGPRGGRARDLRQTSRRCRDTGPTLAGRAEGAGPGEEREQRKKDSPSFSVRRRADPSVRTRLRHAGGPLQSHERASQTDPRASGLPWAGAAPQDWFPSPSRFMYPHRVTEGPRGVKTDPPGGEREHRALLSGAARVPRTHDGPSSRRRRDLSEVSDSGIW